MAMMLNKNLEEMANWSYSNLEEKYFFLRGCHVFQKKSILTFIGLEKKLCR